MEIDLIDPITGGRQRQGDEQMKTSVFEGAQQRRMSYSILLPALLLDAKIVLLHNKD